MAFSAAAYGSCQLTINSSSSTKHSTRIPRHEGCRSKKLIGARFLGDPSKLGGFSNKFMRITGGGNGGRTRCWFKFGKNGVDAEGAGIYGSQSRDDFDRDDVEQYFNYMGMLAVEGTYDKMEALLSLSIHPVDILLMMAASEGDIPKIEELLKAGAEYNVKDADGRTALDRANSDETKQFILNFRSQKV